MLVSKESLLGVISLSISNRSLDLPRKSDPVINAHQCPSRTPKSTPYGYPSNYAGAEGAPLCRCRPRSNCIVAQYIAKLPACRPLLLLRRAHQTAAADASLAESSTPTGSATPTASPSSTGVSPAAHVFASISDGMASFRRFYRQWLVNSVCRSGMRRTTQFIFPLFSSELGR